MIDNEVPTTTTPEGVPVTQIIATEVEDEYQLTIAEGVDDESLLEAPSDLVFSITSYGADYPVDTLVSRLRSESFFVPTFQRQFVWSQKHASRFVESLLMGLPVPGVFLYKELDSGRHLVVDGQQRLRSLQFFYKGTFKEKIFRLQDVQPQWNGKTYAELGEADQRRLDDTIVHATIFQQDEPKNARRSLYFVFERINSGGIRLSPQEIRNCVSDGPLLEIVRQCNFDPHWRQLFGSFNSRQKDQELVLRFFAMLERLSDYKRPMKEFLDDFADLYNKVPAAKLDHLSSTFSRTTELIWSAKGRSAFRPARALNTAVFESVMVAVSNAVIRGIGEPGEIARSYDKLLSNASYMRVCERATADEESVKERHKLAGEAFLVS